MPVYFKCKSCRSEHRSPAGFADKISFDAAPMQLTELRCYGTGRSAAYQRSDLYWRDELGE